MNRHPADLPPVFAQYASLVHDVYQVSAVEWSSSCPKCGGEMHQDGSAPDRCRWFMKGKPVGWCRVCGGLHWPDKAPDYKPPTPAEMLTWKREREESEEARKRSAEKALEHLRSCRLWEQYHDLMDAQGQAWWRGRGIPDSWQAYWLLGWDHDISRWGTPSATIPLFDRERQCLNLKHRLISPKQPHDKYRYNLAGQAQPPFLCLPESSTYERAVVVEGEIKSMVVFIALDSIATDVIGLPGTNPSPEIVAELAKYAGVTLVMDPGAQPQASKLATAIGRQKTRVLIPPAKIDDAILAMQQDGYDVARYQMTMWLKQARTAEK
jgi:hypothetical protein